MKPRSSWGKLLKELSPHPFQNLSSGARRNAPGPLKANLARAGYFSLSGLSLSKISNPVS